MTEPIRIGNAGGYWGDDLTVLRRQIEGGPLDVVTMDFLAEITMSILQKQRSRNPDLGYARDFVDQIAEILPALDESGVTVITNAGGVNPQGCRNALRKVVEEAGLDLPVGLVAGDDVLDRLEDWHDDGLALANMDDDRGYAEARGRLTSANAYLGAAPVVRALELGARILVTGRVTDTGITLAPMIHRFGWAPDDWDRLAAGIVAAHILECGAQSTGGNFTDWRRVPSFHEIGYPVVEMHGDGSFVVTKHQGTGGMVTCATVREQLLYEMGDPHAYITPDVVASFASIQLEQEGEDRVRVWGIRGAPPTDFLKVSASLAQGYKASGAVIVSGPEARDKAEAFAEILWARLPDYEEKLAEYVGADACWGPLSPSRESTEIYLRFGVRDGDRAKVEVFSRMLPALILSGPPGVAVTGGRPRVQEVVAYWPFLVPRDRCAPHVEVTSSAGTEVEDLEHPPGRGDGRCDADAPAKDRASVRLEGGTVKVPLRRLAHGRSGDKGDTCNIGVIARHPALYPWLEETLTAEVVKERFAGICRGEVERHEVPNLDALNFLLHECLGGGGTLALKIDAQGKTLSHALLAMEVEVDAALLERAESAGGAA